MAYRISMPIKNTVIIPLPSIDFLPVLSCFVVPVCYIVMWKSLRSWRWSLKRDLVFQFLPVNTLSVLWIICRYYKTMTMMGKQQLVDGFYICFRLWMHLMWYALTSNCILCQYSKPVTCINLRCREIITFIMNFFHASNSCTNHFFSFSFGAHARKLADQHTWSIGIVVSLANHTWSTRTVLSHVAKVWGSKWMMQKVVKKSGKENFHISLHRLSN